MAKAIRGQWPAAAPMADDVMPLCGHGIINMLWCAGRCAFFLSFEIGIAASRFTAQKGGAFYK